MMNDILLYLLCIAGVIGAAGFGVSIGVRLTLETLSKMEPEKFSEIIKDLRSANDNPGLEHVKDILPKPVTQITLTAANNFLLAHDTVTGQFIAQGADSQELIVSALKRFPDRAFTIAVEKSEVEVTP
jgi:hypothetical protein